jgi:lysophospholipase
MALQDETISYSFPLAENSFSKDLDALHSSLAAYRREGCLTGREMQSIHYQVYLQDKPKAAMVICHDGCESALRYTEWALFFHSIGYQVYMLDFRGHGRSDREIDNRSVTHIDSFRRYAKDLADITSRIDRRLPLHLTAFGMGGSVALLYMQNNPGRIASACLVTPLIGIHMPEPRGWNRWRLTRSVRRGLSRELIPGNVCYQSDESFDRSKAKSFHRFAWYKEKRAADSRLQNNAYSLGWLNAALQASDWLFSRRTRKIESKILLIEAGDDMVVPTDYYGKLLKYLQAGSHVRLAGMDHRIQNGSEAMLSDLMKLMCSFFEISKRS